MHLWNLLLTFILVGYLRMGAHGSAAATLVAMLCGYVFVFWPLGCSLVQMGIAEWMRQCLLRGLAPGLAASVVWVSVKGLASLDSWFRLGTATALGMLVFCGVLWLFCLHEDDRYLLDLLKRRMTEDIWKRRVAGDG